MESLLKEFSKKDNSE